MNIVWATRRGFTLIEIMIVVTIIAILATIGVVSYNSLQNRAKTATIISDVTNATTVFEQYALKHKGALADAAYLRDNLTTSSDNIVMNVQVHNALPLYVGLSSVQNGALFYTICNDLIAEGKGRSTNNGGQQESYFTSCNVYNNNRVEVHGWSSRDINLPVASSTLPDIVSSINYNESWRPGRDQAEKDFYQEWHYRFLAQGGTYPISSFWDGNWCSSNRTDCTPFQPLSAPVITTKDNYYCISAAYEGLNDVIYHVTSDNNTPQKGNCPEV